MVHAFRRVWKMERICLWYQHGGIKLFTMQTGFFFKVAVFVFLLSRDSSSLWLRELQGVAQEQSYNWKEEFSEEKDRSSMCKNICGWLHKYQTIVIQVTLMYPVYFIRRLYHIWSGPYLRLCCAVRLLHILKNNRNLSIFDSRNSITLLEILLFAVGVICFPLCMKRCVK